MQLLHAAWFLATTSDPHTAATFQVLKQYHLLSFKSKTSGYEFYHAITWLTDNTGLCPQEVCYMLLISSYLLSLSIGLVKGLLADGLRVVPPQDAQTCWSWT
jgi:hypothetical protein